MNAGQLRALYLGREPQLAAQVGSIRRLNRGVQVDWLFPDAGVQPCELGDPAPDVIVVDERLWTGELRAQLERLRACAPRTPIVLLCSHETALLGPHVLQVEAVQLVERANTAIVLPGVLSLYDSKRSLPAPRRKQILIIDDSDDDRELYTRALRRAPHAAYAAFEASDGARGIELLRSINPDCILLDYSLPGRNGVEVLRNIRAEWAEIPVVILTGQGNEAVAVEAMKNGAQDYVIKSQLDDEMLHRVIKSACETHALQRRVVQQRDTLALFTRALAHDLKEPLRTIRSYVDLVRTSAELSERNDHFLGTASSAATHMERMVDMVTHYARLEADDVSAEREPCKATDLVRQALKNLAQQTRDVPHEFVLGELPALCGNAVQLTSVFQNLISNALNYGDKPLTRVRISCVTEELQHVFTVEDNGAGIDPRHAHLLFLPFQRLSTGPTRGSGLGLALCKRIVENHSGRIWIESELGGWTKVHFSLPATTTPHVSIPPSLDAGAAARTSDAQAANELANVLLVEDNEADVVLTQVLLQEMDGLLFNVYSVPNGEQALAWLSDPGKPQIDLILLDINMPVMDGFTFLQTYRREPEVDTIPVIMCSTSEEAGDLVRAQKLGVAAYVTKPVRFQQLEAPLRRVQTLVVNRDQGALRLERRLANLH